MTVDCSFDELPTSPRTRCCDSFSTGSYAGSEIEDDEDDEDDEDEDKQSISESILVSLNKLDSTLRDSCSFDVAVLGVGRRMLLVLDRYRRLERT